MWQMRQNLVAQFVQLLKCRLCNVWSDVVVDPFVDQCWLKVLHLSVHLIDLLRTLLRGNGFTRFKKAIVDQPGSRPPNNDHDLFFGTSLALGSFLELLLSPVT